MEIKTRYGKGRESDARVLFFFKLCTQLWDGELYSGIGSYSGLYRYNEMVIFDIDSTDCSIIDTEISKSRKRLQSFWDLS